MPSLDRFLSADIRHTLEERYYARINAQSQLEVLQSDPDFLTRLELHVALFSDHGVVHVRDVAQQLLAILDLAHGVLFPSRPSSRLERMRGYGVLVAYLHDIGMVDFSSFGRAMHPEFACQAVYEPTMDDVVQTMWVHNCSNLPWYLLNLASEGVLTQPPLLLLRELLALSMCHSKSKVPAAVLNDPERLRALLLTTLSTKLAYLFHEQQIDAARARLAALAADDARRVEAEAALAEAMAAYEQLRQREPDRHNPQLSRHYQNPGEEAFRWLVSPHPQLRAWVVDVIDTLRALRCADALRQRGAVLKTSGGYEILVNQRTSNAVYALRLRDERLFLFESPDPVSAGEANIASSELDPAGDVRISFVRGAFPTAEATRRAVRCAAIVVHDIQSDIIGSFQRAGVFEAPSELKPAGTMRVLLEETDDNFEFASLVQQQLIREWPDMTGSIQVVPSLQLASALERALYQAAEVITWDPERRREVLARIGQSGHRVAEVDPQAAFEHVRLATIEAGQLLMEAGSHAAFVHVPLEPGLQIVPLGGYQAFGVQAWMPLGITGVIRGGTRNATVVATRALRLLMIPRTVYLTHWHHTHSPASLQHVLQEG